MSVLLASPRQDGNSRALADALACGVEDAGNTVELADLGEHVTGLMRDCRRCRRPDGSCSIEDGLQPLLLGTLLEADAWVYATPIYFYGVSGLLKTFLDRLFCFIAASYPGSDDVVARLSGKRSAVLLSAEESYLGARLAILGQLQEISRYLHHDLVGTVVGVGNRRGEVRSDPAEPLAAARTLGARLFTARVTDYRVDSARPGSVWGG